MRLTAAAERLEPRMLLSATAPRVAVGAAAGHDPWVRLYDDGGTQRLAVAAYPDFYRGGVRVAVGDFNADGVADIAAAPTDGLLVTIRVHSGTDGRLLNQIQPFGDFRGGAYLAAADFDGDGRDELVVGMGTGGDGTLRVFDMTAASGTLRHQTTVFYDNPTTGVAYTRGLRVAAADVDGDGRPDVVAATGPGGGSRIKAIDPTSGRAIQFFYAFGVQAGDSAGPHDGSLFVAAGDADGDGQAELFVTPGSGPAELRVFSGGVRPLGTSALLRSVVKDSAATGGLRVAAADINRDGRLDAVFAPGPGGSGSVEVLDILTGAELPPRGPAVIPAAAGSHLAAVGPAPLSAAANRAPLPENDFFAVLAAPYDAQPAPPGSVRPPFPPMPPLTGNLFGNDTDPDGHPLSVVWHEGHYELAVQPDGSFTYTPPVVVWPTTQTFRYRVSDGYATAEAVVSIYLLPNPDNRGRRPVVSPGGRLTVTVGSGDSSVLPVLPQTWRDPFGNQVPTGGVLQQPEVGFVWVNTGTGEFEYFAPDVVDETTTVTFEVVQTDQFGNVTVTTIDITIEPPPPPPPPHPDDLDDDGDGGGGGGGGGGGPQVDLDADSDNNGVIDQTAAEDAVEADAPGRVLRLNDNDDNRNGRVNLLDGSDGRGFKDGSGAWLNDHRLERIILGFNTALDALQNYTVRLAADAGLRLWRTADKRALSRSYSYTIGGATPPPTDLYVEGVATGQFKVKAALYDAAGNFVSEDILLFTVVKLDLTAYRPQTDHITQTRVPEQKENAVGIRRNGDDDNGDGAQDFLTAHVSGEDDLIRIDITRNPDPVAGLEYVLRRTDDNPSGINMRLWSSSDKSGQVMTNTYEIVIGSGGVSSASTLWAEWIEMDSSRRVASFSLEVRVSGKTVLSDVLTFKPFNTIVVALSGEQFGPFTNTALRTAAQRLYDDGYDSYYFDEDAVTAVPAGTGIAHDTVLNALNGYGVSNIVVFGFSHGGGSTWQLVNRLNAERATLPGFTIPYTAYVDGIYNLFSVIDPETRRPPSTLYHTNLYQTTDWLHGALVPGADENIDVETAWGKTGIGHSGIGGDARVVGHIVGRVKARAGR